MFLRRLSLAGFKSFADPVEFSFTGGLAAIVGPNGCGKSNTVDAVRWLLGERSAQALRGDSGADVLFAGNSERPPARSAWVEMELQLPEPGPDAAAAPPRSPWLRQGELRVRREIERDGDSNWWINGRRVRRRDVHELFLGEGLSARGYALIEQNRVSRIIEAGPETLRTYLEEAAGTALFAERRDETLARIAETRQHLERVALLVDEGRARAHHLAEQAERARSWRQLSHDIETARRALLVARVEAATEALERARERRQHCADALSRLQQSQQQAASQRAQTLTERVEAETRHRQTEAVLRRLQSERAAARLALDQAEAEARRHAELGARLRAEQEGAAAELERDRQQLEQARQQRFRAETEFAACATPAPEAEMRERAAELAALEQSLKRLLQQQPQLAAAKARLEAELAALDRQLQALDRPLAPVEDEPQPDVVPLRTALAASEDERAAALAAASVAAETVNARREQAQTQQEARQQAAAVVTTLRARAQGLRRSLQQLSAPAAVPPRGPARVADRPPAPTPAGSASGLGHAPGRPLGRDEGEATAWLREQGIEAAPALFETLEMPPETRLALAAVLGPWLQARLVPALEPLPLDTAPAGLRLLRRYEPVQAVDWCGYRLSAPLAPKVLERLLAGWSMVEGDALRVDAAGCIRGPDWFAAPPGAAQSVALGWLHLRDELAEVEVALPLAEEAAHQAEAAEGGSRAALAEAIAAEQMARRQVELAAASVRDVERALLQAESALRAAEVRSHERAARQRAIEQERLALQGRQQPLAGRMAEAEAALLAAAQQQAELAGRSDALRRQLQALRAEHARAVEVRHRAELALQSARQAEQALEQASARQARQVEALAGRWQDWSEQAPALPAIAPLVAELQRLEQALAATEAEGQGLHADWLAAVAAEDAAERQQLQLASRLEQAQAALLEAERGDATAAAQAQAALEELVTEVESAGLLDERLSLAAWLERDLERVLAAWREPWMKTGSKNEGKTEGEAVLRAALKRAQAAREALERQGGPVNLAAEHEFAEAEERALRLEAEATDVEAGLQGLEQALAQIEDESRRRLREAATRINMEFARVFAELFGGGSAALVLQGDDPLSAEVRIEARPPGKRVSTLKALSGGEKALAALALVFALFELNPAPFCWLDEVDAPLDESNAGRYARLLERLSARVQCIVITHNKTTMAHCPRLLGVTMPEPGVSRVVAVQVAEALAMAMAMTQTMTETRASG